MMSIKMPKSVYVYAEEGKKDNFSYRVRKAGDVEYVRKDLSASRQIADELYKFLNIAIIHNRNNFLLNDEFLVLASRSIRDYKEATESKPDGQ